MERPLEHPISNNYQPTQFKLLKWIVYSAEWTDLWNFGSSPSDIYSLDFTLLGVLLETHIEFINLALIICFGDMGIILVH